MSGGPGVLFVSNFLTAAGLNRVYSAELADRLEARGWRVVRTSTQLDRVRRLADMVYAVWKHRRTYSVAHVDVFSGAAFAWAEAACLALRALGKPYVLTLRGGNLPEFARRWPRRVRRLLASAAVVTVPSRYLGEQMARYAGELVVIPNAVETGAFAFTPRTLARPRLIWVRAFHAIYNPVLAVEVLAQLGRTHHDATLAMLGPDKDGSRSAVEQRAVELGVRDRLTLVGQVPKAEIPRHLAAADVFLNTTDVDNTPISVLEAMAAGLCVVSTNVGGIPYLVSDGREALLVPPRDPSAMAAAVSRVLSEPGIAAALSQGARELACGCDWSAVLAKWDATLHDAEAHAR